jgi:hypothetical protein
MKRPLSTQTNNIAIPDVEHSSGSLAGVPRKSPASCLTAQNVQVSPGAYLENPDSQVGAPSPVVTLEQVKECMLLDIKGKNRSLVASMLRVPASRVDDWLAISKPNRIPIELVDDWAKACNSTRLPELLLRASGLGDLLDLGRATLAKDRAEREAITIKRRLRRAG